MKVEYITIDLDNISPITYPYPIIGKKGESYVKGLKILIPDEYSDCSLLLDIENAWGNKYRCEIIDISDGIATYDFTACDLAEKGTITVDIVFVNGKQIRKPHQSKYYCLDAVSATDSPDDIPVILTSKIREEISDNTRKSHEHGNKSTLDKLGENDNGNLLFDGNPIEGAPADGSDNNFSQFIEENASSVNLYPPMTEGWLDNTSLATNGNTQVATKSNYFVTPQIKIEPNTTYTITGKQWVGVEIGLTNAAKGRAYDELGNVLSVITFTQNENGSWTFTTPENANYMLFACYKTPFGKGNTAGVDNIVPVFNSSFMLVKGKELPGVYEPYGKSEYRLKNIGLPNKSVKLENVSDESMTVFAPLAGKTIVNFGDSIFGNAQAPTDISTFLAEKTGATVYNCGFGGCRMSDTHPTEEYAAFSMVKLADAISSGDFTLQESAVASTEVTLNNSIRVNFATLKTIDFSKVDIMTIAYASNDFKGIALDNENNSLDTTTFAGALRYSVEKLLMAYPNLRIFVLSAAWRFYIDSNTNEYTEDSNTYTNTNGLTIKDYNTVLKEVAEEYNLPYVDDYNIGIGKHNCSYYFGTTDPAHHLETGRKLIAEHLAKELY